MKCVCEGVSLRNGRETNMDSLLLKTREIEGEALWLAAVCDGVGSTRDGGFASGEAVRRLSRWLDGISSPEGLGIRLCEELRRINRAIVEEAALEGLKTASTVSVLLLYDGRYYTAHAGDSRIYQMKDAKLLRLTEDQESGGKLTNYLGKTRDFRVDYGEGEIGTSAFLVCSDGLYKRAEQERITQWLRRITPKNRKQIMREMIRCVEQRGESDNITVACAICEGREKA